MLSSTFGMECAVFGHVELPSSVAPISPAVRVLGRRELWITAHYSLMLSTVHRATEGCWAAAIWVGVSSVF